MTSFRYTVHAFTRETPDLAVWDLAEIPAVAGNPGALQNCHTARSDVSRVKVRVWLLRAQVSSHDQAVRAWHLQRDLRHNVHLQVRA